MAVISEIIERAYRKIGVAAHDEPLTADQAAIGLSAFNDMVLAWPLMGADVAVTEYAAGDNFPLSPQFVEPAMYLLAERLAQNFGVALTFNPDQHRRNLQAALLSRDTVSQIDGALRPSTRWWL